MKFGDINFSTKAMHEYYEYSKRESQHIDTLGSSPQIASERYVFLLLINIFYSFVFIFLSAHNTLPLIPQLFSLILFIIEGVSKLSYS